MGNRKKSKKSYQAAEGKFSLKQYPLETALIVLIVVWSFWNSFLGIDMVDTGYYYYQYLHPTASNIPYTAYLATLIGAGWLRLFPSFGLWGLNVLELLLEYSLCYFVYRTFRSRFRRLELLAAEAVCMLLIGTYVNVFNYHQLSMYFCTLMLCSMYTACTRQKTKWFFIAGLFGGLAITARMPSVLTLCCIACIVYWGVVVERTSRRLVVRTGAFLGGYAVIAAVYSLLLLLMGLFNKVISEIFRLGELGESDSTAYGVSGQFSNLIWDSIHGLEAALLFFVCVVILAVTIERACRYVRANDSSAKATILCALTVCVGGIVFLGGARYAVYDAGKAPGFIQVTSFSWFIYGFFLLFGLVETIRGFISKKEEARVEGALAFMGLALMFLCFVGSAARAKHAILGMWILMPLMIARTGWYLRNQRTVSLKRFKLPDLSQVTLRLCGCIVVLFGMFILAKFLQDTNNFDSTDRRELVAEINSDRVVYLKTTQRQANTVNDLLEEMENYKEEDASLMVIGNPILLYTLADLPAYVKPWVSGTSYTVEDLEAGLAREEESERPLPIIVWAKTNPYEGFAASDYQWQRAEQERINANSPKTEVINDFMDRNGYGLVFENSYFRMYYLVPEVKHERPEKKPHEEFYVPALLHSMVYDDVYAV